MNIGIICYPSVGGSGLIATELGLRLANKGHQIHFISYSMPFRLSQFDRNIYFHPVDPINYPLFKQTLYTFSLTAKIVEIAQDYALDIVHAHYSIPHSLSAHLAREISRVKFKIMTTLHGTDVTVVGQNKPLFSLNKYAIEKSDTVTTVSHYQREYTNRYFSISKKIKVIYNFVDSDVFRPGLQKEKKSCIAKEGEKVIMHVSNFRDPKNPRGVIEVFYRVQKKISCRLALVGEGPGIGEIKNLCQQYGICDKVSFLGEQECVASVISLADCILQPSYEESFGLVLLESMACGIPTVSSNVGGIPEVVIHGETGFYANADDYDVMANHVIKICTSETLAGKLGSNGRERAIQAFSPDMMVAKYIACYQDLLGKRCKNKA